ncbi:MAG: sugar nucleotide-binding protein [Magnetospirillum sp.]|nr:sugar nucleotide-binding protein [Magnetospirillum sp.]
MGEGLQGRTILITGAAGMLGRAFVEALADHPGARVLAYPRRELDVTDRNRVMSLAKARPDLILHCAAHVNADHCEDDPVHGRRIQVEGTDNVAELAAESGAQVVYPQSFLIFDGSVLPITDNTRPAPLSVYGQIKLEAERRLVERLPGSLVVRMAGFFGGDEGDKNFVGGFTRHLTRLLAEGVDRVEVGDRVWQPTYTLDLARNVLALAAAGKSGTYTMASHGEATFHALAAACVELLGLSSRLRIIPTSAAKVAARERARRPDRAVMDNARLRAEGLDCQRPWRAALAEYLERPYFRTLFAAYR